MRLHVAINGGSPFTPTLNVIYTHVVKGGPYFTRLFVNCSTESLRMRLVKLYQHEFLSFPFLLLPG